MNSKYSKKIEALMRGEASDAYAKAMTALDAALLALQDLPQTTINDRLEERLEAARRLRSLAFEVDRDGVDPERWEGDPLPPPEPGSMQDMVQGACEEVRKNVPELTDAREKVAVELMIQLAINDCWPSDTPLGSSE